MRIEDAVIIVTGASSGIGLATARLLATKDAQLVLAARSREKLEALAKELPRSIAVPTDMSEPREIKAMVKQAVEYFGKVDALINVAGQGYDALVEEIDPELFRRIFDLNLMGPMLSMQAVIPIFRSRGGGSIVNISSGTALVNLPNMSPYASLKRALATLSLTAREELKADKIVVCVVYPYITIGTEFEKRTLRQGKVDLRQIEFGGPFPPDSTEFVANLILEALQKGKPEVFAHAWMEK